MRAGKHIIRILRGAVLLAILFLVCTVPADICWSAPSSENNEEAYAEYSIKAAYLLKFGGFVEWPQGALPRTDAPFVIGVLGEDPFGSTLDQIVGVHAVQGRPVALKRLSKLDQVRGVSILYISPSERDKLPAILASLSGKSILTVSDADMPGVIINFVLDRDRVRFDIDLQQAERAGLRISSKLLTVARAVKTA